MTARRWSSWHTVCWGSDATAVASLAICYTIAGFCLWAIGLALEVQPVDALRLFPFGLRMGILQTPRRYCPGILVDDVAVQLFLGSQMGGGRWQGAV